MSYSILLARFKVRLQCPEPVLVKNLLVFVKVTLDDSGYASVIMMEYVQHRQRDNLPHPRLCRN